MAPKINIEIVYGDVKQQFLISLEFDQPISIAEALQQAQSLKKLPEFDLQQIKVGIFGKVQSLETMLRVGDRVEIYRPLYSDPKAARRVRVKKKIS